jgi:hypothetical protein
MNAPASSRFVQKPPSCLIRLGALLLASLLSAPSFAASSAGCEGGGFTVLGRSGEVEADIPSAGLPARFRVQGKYVQFDVVSASFAIENYAFLPTTNPLDMTNGMLTPVFASKRPNHRGLVLTSAIELSLEEEVLELQRMGPGLSMKIQAKDCAQGGVFQMEPERGDGTRTVITHLLANAATALTPFYFDNPRFRAREGDVVPYKDTTVTVSTRVNIANDFSPRFVARDSAQVADRINEPACSNTFISRVTGAPVNVQHCGGRSIWSVASGGRMGFVSGEDAIEVAPPPTICTHKCQAQNRVRGRSVKLGFPFPVPDASRLKPRAPTAAAAL